MDNNKKILNHEILNEKKYLELLLKLYPKWAAEYKKRNSIKV